MHELWFCVVLSIVFVVLRAGIILVHEKLLLENIFVLLTLDVPKASLLQEGDKANDAIEESFLHESKTFKLFARSKHHTPPLCTKKIIIVFNK